MPDYSIENTLHNEGYTYVCGVDEAGRGPLCGPVFAAACILPDGLYIEGLNDSKKLKPWSYSETSPPSAYFRI